MTRAAPGLCALALICAAAACSHATSSSSASASPAASAAILNDPASASDGAAVYTANCSSCHQTDGTGVPGAFPPLAGNPVVTGGARRVVAIVKNGMSGKIVVNGVAYSGTMPHWGQLISDEEIAAVVTYIRVSWNNKASPVSLADVKAVTGR